MQNSKKSYDNNYFLSVYIETISTALRWVSNCPLANNFANFGIDPLRASVTFEASDRCCDCHKQTNI